MLTLAELEKHRAGHEHSRECLDQACGKRFCLANKRGASAGVGTVVGEDEGNGIGLEGRGFLYTTAGEEG